MLSMAMEQSGTHRRLALNMVGLFGGGSSSRKLVFGFMAASAFLSMWISNAATVLMLLPIVTAVVEKSSNRRLKVALLLGIAYAACVGGIATPIGTPPILVFGLVYSETFGETPSFATWMIWAVPITVIMLPAIGFWLTRGLQSDASLKMPETGSWRYEEIATLAVFGVTALLWITRLGPWGGWSEWLDLPYANDAMVALVAVVVMHILPNGKGESLLSWDNAVKIPWGV